MDPGNSAVGEHDDEFPFVPGVPAEQGVVVHKHADGSVTQVTYTPFVYAAQSPRWAAMRDAVRELSLEPSARPQVIAATAAGAEVAVITALARDGCVVLSGAAHVEECTLAAAELRSILGSAEEIRGIAGAGCEKCFPFLAHPSVMSVCSGVLGGQVLRMAAEDLQAHVAPPSLFTEEHQIRQLPWELHFARAVAWKDYPRRTSSVQCRGATQGDAREWSLRHIDCRLNAAWVLDGPTSSHSGGTALHVALGSHRWLPSRKVMASDVVEVHAQQGDVVLYLDDMRYCEGSGLLQLAVGYQCAVLAQSENQYVVAPPRLALEYPPHIQRLIGYGKPGQVLNKLYCAGPPHEILQAWSAYGDRSVDWAKSEAQKRADVSIYASIPHGIPNSIDLDVFRDDVESRTSRIAPSPGISAVPAASKNAAEDLLSVLFRDGVAILHGAIASEDCDQVMDDLRPYSEAVGGAAVGCILARSARAWTFAAHPVILEVCEAVLGRQALRMRQAELEQQLGGRRRLPWQIHVALTIPKQAGDGPQQLHRDGDLSLLDLSAELDHAVSVIWALDADFSPERGATVAVPGSHLWPRNRVALSEDAFPAVMPRGSALIYLGNTVHAAGGNRTAAPRIALNVSYNSAFLKQEENMYVAYPPKVARNFSPFMASLLGYTDDEQLESCARL